jgi:hypothetical protein
VSVFDRLIPLSKTCAVFSEANRLLGQIYFTIYAAILSLLSLISFYRHSKEVSKVYYSGLNYSLFSRWVLIIILRFKSEKTHFSNIEKLGFVYDDPIWCYFFVAYIFSGDLVSKK